MRNKNDKNTAKTTSKEIPHKMRNYCSRLTKFVTPHKHAQTHQRLLFIYA